MIKILAVSDRESASLENILKKNPAISKNLDYLISCGDLGKDYLTYLSGSLNLELMFVYGNHDVRQKESPCRIQPAAFNSRIALPGSNLHKNFIKRGEYSLIGFEGSRWYNGQGTQYEEKEMKSHVNSLLKKIKLKHMFGKISGKPKNPLIVVSHAPIADVHDLKDPCHKGFNCFKTVIEKLQPVLWLHGHIHQPSLLKNQATTYESTRIINVCEYRFISIDAGGKIKVSYNWDKI